MIKEEGIRLKDLTKRIKFWADQGYEVAMTTDGQGKYGLRIKAKSEEGKINEKL